MANNLDNLMVRKAVLSGEAQEQLVAEELRRKKTDEEDEGTERPQSLREAVRSAKMKEDSRGMIGEKAESALNPAKMGTSSLLKWAWEALIPSFGLSLIWINMHVFLRLVLGEKLFCKLGEEWIPKQASSALGEEGKMAGKGIGLVEGMALLAFDLVLIFIILAGVSFIALIFDVIQNPLSYIGEALGTVLNVVWDSATGMFIEK